MKILRFFGLTLTITFFLSLSLIGGVELTKIGTGYLQTLGIVFVLMSGFTIGCMTRAIILELPHHKRNNK